MDDGVWARHANPLSVWSRIAAFPLLILAIWSRAWLGWAALLPVGLALVWPWYNPRAFVFFGKLRFADRMAWLYEDMKDATPQYRSWLY